MELESNLMNGYVEAYALACEKFISMDHEVVSLNTNTSFDKIKKKMLVEYLKILYVVDCETGEVEKALGEEKVSVTVKVLILHYLLHSRIKPLSDKLISFKELSGGTSIYYPSFYKRAITPLIKRFGNQHGDFFLATDALGGCKEKFGTVSATINIFPLVPVTYVLWDGDEDIPNSGTILFDDSITSYLPGEDIVLAASFGVYEMMKIASEILKMR